MSTKGQTVSMPMIEPIPVQITRFLAKPDECTEIEEAADA